MLQRQPMQARALVPQPWMQVLVLLQRLASEEGLQLVELLPLQDLVSPPLVRPCRALVYVP